MIRPYILAENNWKDLRESSFDLAILPWGACEAHNYHLPYGTDVLEADYVAAEAAGYAWQKGAKLTVLPAIPFGVNTGQADILLDMNLNPSTQFAILRDVIQVLDRHRIHKLIILNSHGGNDFRTMLRELGLQFPAMFLAACNWYQAVDQKKYFEHKDDHAGEMETSVILALRPDLVKLEQAGDGASRKFRFAAMREGWGWAERRWSQITRDTGVGDPRQATAEKGKAYLAEVTSKVGEFFYQVAITPQSDLYE